MFERVNTSELLRRAKAANGEVVEAVLSGNGLRSTHMLYVYKGRLYDCGVEGRFDRVSFSSFKRDYRDASWRIETEG